MILGFLLAFSGCSLLKESIQKALTLSKFEIEKKWDTVKWPSAYAWVDYDRDLNTRSEVNFAKGLIEIEAVIPADTENLEEIGIKKISNQVEKIFETQIVALKTKVLEGQVKNEAGEEVTPYNLKAFIKKQIVPKTKKTVFTAKDGVKRAKMRSTVKMAKGHLGIRAKQYQEIVRQKADEFNIEPHLIMSMIHQESYFNPLARSEDGALGLMQLIPRYGAQEAYAHIYKETKLPGEDWLFDPVNNIELGVVYYHLLKSRHFKDVRGHSKNRYVSLCAYNAGPTRLRRLIEPESVGTMSDTEFLNLLISKVPAETQNYLTRIVGLLKRYGKVR